ncbi:MAG: C13 family peptidase, partial [Alphaproteobacteria bacterium]
LPVASITTLRLALNEIAVKMGEEDILFLYITSHGRRGRISVRIGGIKLRDLRAGTLRRILDQAGIKNRVLVISACYSGSFIEPLRDDNTLIMTASAADLTSFGCGHDGTFTYFGNALIGIAMEKEFSMARAFEIAVRSIEKREKKEGLGPSKPQIRVGLAIGPVLQRIEKHLRTHR